MSAVGEKVAVLSLGLSCQTSRQIDQNIPLLKKLTGDITMERQTLPFDWLIGTPSGVIATLEDRQFFPDDAADLKSDKGRLRHCRREILYWHDSHTYSRPGKEGFDSVVNKFRFTGRRLKQLSKLDRVVAVISNSQSNLRQVEDAHEIQLTNTTTEQCRRVGRKLEAFLGCKVDMLVVSRNLWPQSPPNTSSLAVYHLPANDSLGWGGDTLAWSAIFEDYFSLA